MDEVIEKENIKIEDMIYEIRGKQVILDSDIAKLYKCLNGTKDINKAVKRNIGRFPEDFYFKLTYAELDIIVSRFQSGTLKQNRGTNIKYLPYVFTEQGVAMLSSVLHTDIAVTQSVIIMRAFIAMKKYISSDLIEQSHINKMVIKHDEDIKLLQESFIKLSSKEVNNNIFFEGEIYDAYSKIIDIFNIAKQEIILIDNYLDKNMLDFISKAKVNVILITADKLDNIDLMKYRKQYSNLSVVINKSFHDRFIIIDKEILYHLGASLNSLGKKCFAISKIDEMELLINLLKKL